MVEEILLDLAKQPMKKPNELFVDVRVPSMGSSTILLAQVNEDRVDTAAIGDVSYMMLRKRGLDLVVEQEPQRQEHSFDRPFSLGQGGDDPTSAIVNSHEVKNGDIFVLGTDGLWDNLYTRQVLDLMRPFVRYQD